jgi:hypothetical protein
MLLRFNEADITICTSTDRSSITEKHSQPGRENEGERGRLELRCLAGHPIDIA